MKILALTSIRSDYDLLSSLYKLLHNDNEIDFKIIVSGAHLSSAHGYTKQYILKDGFDILLEIETLINSDSKRARLKTASIFLQNSIDVVSKFNPDLILYAGDREDVIMGALLGIYLNIPTIHFYGGDHEQDGHQDTYIRHAISKLSSLHFVSNKRHKKRLIAIGESPDSIYVIGSISLDKFSDFNMQNLRVFFSNKNFFKNFALVIYHPLQNECPKRTFDNILSVLKEREIKAVVSYPNTDPNYLQIVNIIEKYKKNKNFIFYKNLNRDLFLTIFSKADFIIGNSSAGIYEAATIKKPAINVGIRQLAREAPCNVIFCKSNKIDINRAIEKVTSLDFKASLDNIINIYGDGKSAKRAYTLIKSLNFNKYIPKVYDPLSKYVK